MEYSRRRGDGELPGGELIRSSARVENWHLSEKIRDNVYKGDLSGPDKEQLKGDGGFGIPKFNLRTKIKERAKGSKTRKRDSVNSKPQTARDANETRPEMKRYRKPSDRVRRQSPVMCWKDVGKVETAEGPNTTVAWVREESSDETMGEMSRVKNSPRKRKKKNEEKGKECPGQTEKEGSKELERKVVGKREKSKKSAEDENHHPLFGESLEDGTKRCGESPGKAVVIYQRENRRKCLNPQTGDGFQYEQISFAGRYDLVQSKKSLSEPRHNSLNSLKDLYVARRRTRFRMEPVKPTPNHSDFQSTVNLSKDYRTSSEYQKVSENTESVLQSHQTSTENGRSSKGCQILKQSTEASHSQKTPTDKEEVAARLKETAEKKLNLHREMIRVEKINKKKFWESIQRSLNYRCALAEMLSSTQSFLSREESSRMVSSCNGSTERSTYHGILVQENVVEQISSHQSTESPENSKTKNSKKGKGKTYPSPPIQMATYRVVQNVTQPFLVRKDEMEEEIIRKHDLDNPAWGVSSQSTALPTENLLNQSTSSLRDTTSGKWNLFESCLDADTNPSSELESLMAKLSQEIRRCSHFIKELNSSDHTDKDKLRDCLSCKVSASDSRLKVIKGYESRGEDGNSGEGLNTITVYRIAESVEEESKMRRFKVGGGRKGGDNTVEVKHSRKKDSKRRKRQKGTSDAEPIFKRVESNGSYCSSCESSSTSSLITSKRIGSGANREIICCDHCSFLKNRILKLERDLERIEKILPFYPVEYQDSLKDCLERLKTASDCVLKRLESCAKSRHEEHQKDANKVGVMGDAKRPRSAPTSNSQTGGKSLLRSSTSDNEVSLGKKSIGVTTECMMLGEKEVPDGGSNVKVPQPSSVVNGNSSPTPATDPPVKTFTDNASSNPFLDLVPPLAKSNELNSKSVETPTNANGNSPVEKNDSTSAVKKESTSLNQEQSCQEDSKYVGRAEECQSVSSHPSEMSSESTEKAEPANNKVKETEVTSLFPGNQESVVKEKGETEVGKSKTSEKKERPKWSRIPTRRKATPSDSHKKADSVSVNSSWGTLSKSDGNSEHLGSEVSLERSPETRRLKLTKIVRRREKSLRCKRKMKADKSTQVYVKRESGGGTERRLSDAGTQTEGKFDGTTSSKVTKDDKQVQTCTPSHLPIRTNLIKRRSWSNSSDAASQVDFIGSSPLSILTNVSIQTSRPNGLTDSMANVAVQTNLPTEEEMKYKKDLNVQKKVNMAIAELCFHLSQPREEGKA